MSLVPRPATKPQTLLALYRKFTGDREAKEEFIRATLITDTRTTRLQIISLKMKGFTYQQIAAALRLRSKYSVRDQVERAMRRVWKELNGVPRFYKVGRKKTKTEVVVEG